MGRLLYPKRLILEWLGFLLIAGALVAAALVFQHAWLGAPHLRLQKPTSVAASPIITKEPPPPIAAGDDLPLELPRQILLNVPFSAQAPKGDWSEPWADACEEASTLMAMAWVRQEQKSIIHPERARREILDMVDWEVYHFGYHRDTALGETQKLFTRYFGYQNVKLGYDISLEDIKSELGRGNLLIVPASGLVLARENPYYSSPPPYHMVVVSGYDDETSQMIVNDPGTRRGQGFRYSYGLFEDAIHDWTGDEKTVLEGRRGMIIVSGESK